MFEEVKEMIDSTIYTNGRGEVTAKNVNLAMHGCVDAIGMTFGMVNDAVKTVEDKVTALEENGTGGGAGALRWWLAHESFGIVNTPEQTQENIATYNKLVEDKYASVILYYGADMSSMSVYTSAPVVVQYAILQGETQIILSASMAIEEGYPMECIAVLPFPDGTMEVFTWHDLSTPAPSGPLRVWINEDLTDKQKSENAAAHAAIKNGETNVQILYDYGDGFYEIYELRSIAVMDGLVGFIVSVGINEEHFYETDSYILNEDGTVFISE